jgi:protein-S-isoprenylcysteine O-methyltransferase Ste14
MLIRHLIAILVLPFMAVLVIPRWLLNAYGGTARWPNPETWVLGHVLGALFLIAGFSLFLWTLYLFAARGKGTLAPWDPPTRLVVSGPYRYMRNPMISGVLMILAGETLVHGSLTLFGWFLAFLLLNQIYFVLLEEPMLENRFGDDYRQYKAAVPRWIPRFKPWEPISKKMGFPHGS